METYTTDVIEAILKDYQDGMVVREIVERHGGNAQAVHRCVRRAGIVRRLHRAAPRQWSNDDVQLVQKMLLDGDPILAIARHFEVGAEAVRYLVRSRELDRPEIRNRARWSDHGMWRGGKWVNEDGYVQVRLRSDDPMHVMVKGPYIPEHRLVMARHLGRPLTRQETVHHKNGDRHDNRIENLQLRTGRHGSGTVWQCRSCGSHDIEAVAL